MNKKLIEKLKNNEKPFGLLSEEEQECLKNIAKSKSIEMFNWERWEKGDWEVSSVDSAYRISPDYNPEPEYTTLIIEVKDGILGVEWSSLQFIALHEILDMPNFRGFFAKDDKTSTEHFVHIDGVAKSLEDHKVFARFKV